jgi:PiT family inorganic phosphate transporter
MIGLFLGLVFMTLVLNLSRRSNVARSQKIFRKMQLLSAGIFSLGHGMNDAQKTMGIIAIVLFSKGYLGTTFHIPFWVIFLCYLFIALGTLSGGWRIVKTMGTKITKLQPMGGFCAETAAAFSIIGASVFGIPVSTTHTITGPSWAWGATKRLTARPLGGGWQHHLGWVLTIPIAAVHFRPAV